MDAAAAGGDDDASPSGEDSDGPLPVTFHSYYYHPRSAEFPGADSVSMVENGSAGTFLGTLLLSGQKLLQHKLFPFEERLP